MREPAHFFEHRPAIRGKAHADDRAHLLMQRVDRAIGMRPAIGERLRIERADMPSHLRCREQPRTLGQQQADGELNRRDVVDEIEPGDRVEQIAIALWRQPRMKGDERRDERDARGRANVDRIEEVGARVPLVEDREHTIVQR